MNLEPPLIKNQSSEFDSASLNNKSDQTSSEDDDPYSFSSTSTSLIGLAIVFLMLGIPFLAILNERAPAKKSIMPTLIDTNGPQSSSTLTISWISKFSC